ncbi:DUF885 domain-containing protein [Pseudonocardiaceae bacterium YIM PH 21723]|nr:DUF885 domain-containing protein [Pseudonocardiaceae bacterium YIM PH 21723]
MFSVTTRTDGPCEAWNVRNAFTAPAGAEGASLLVAVSEAAIAPDLNRFGDTTFDDVTQTATLPELLEVFLGWHLDHDPVGASALGAPGRDHTLGDFSTAGFAAHLAEAREWLTRFEQHRSAALGLHDSVDVELAISMLRGTILRAEAEPWRSDPTEYTAPIFNATFTTFLHRLHPEAELVESVCARLSEVPEVLRACRRNLDPDRTPQLAVDRALGQAVTAAEFLRETLPAEVHDPRLRAELHRAAEPAIAAFAELEAFLREFPARGDWRIGEARYSALLRDHELLGYGAAELHSRGLRAYADLDAQLSEVAPDWRARMRRLQDDHPPTEAAMLAEYIAETERARQFTVDRDLVTMPPGENCRVLPSPAFQRPIFPVAFYVEPPALTRSRTGHFFVPYTPAGFTEDQVRQRLRGNCRAQMPTISVHESYPGHHWHLSWAADTPRTIRKVMISPYFAEGWGLYVERLFFEQGYFTDPRHALAHLDGQAFRAARIVVDTALHCGEMTREQARTYLLQKTTLTEDTAAAEVNRYCSWPTQAPSYLTGCLEILDIRGQYLRERRGSLKQFHDTIAGAGVLPLGLARKVALESE